MSDHSSRSSRWTRRQVTNGAAAAFFTGSMAALFPELGANAAVRDDRAAPAGDWYLEVPATQIELTSAESSASTSRLAILADRSEYAATASLALGRTVTSKTMLRTMTDGRTIRAAGVAMSDDLVLATWNETLADGSPGRQASILHRVTDSSITVVAIGGSPGSLKAVPAQGGLRAAAEAGCPTGTHPLRYCTNLDFDNFTACCGGCVVTFVGGPLAGALCALIVCTSCYTSNCSAYTNTCVVNS